MTRNLRHHLDLEKQEGISYTQWQAEQLAALADFRESTNTALGNYFKEFNERRLNAYIASVKSGMERAEYALMRMAEDQYRKAIFNAGVAYNTGAVTLPQAVDQATNDFLSRGLNCIEYRNVRRVNIDAYAEMAVRTLVTRPHLQDESAQFERYREILGNMAPDSLDKFMKSHQKMRYLNYN